MRRNKKKPTKERRGGGGQIDRGYCFDHCGYVVAVVREKEKERERKTKRGCVTWLLVWYIIKLVERRGGQGGRQGERLGKEGRVGGGVIKFGYLLLRYRSMRGETGIWVGFFFLKSLSPLSPLG